MKWAQNLKELAVGKKPSSTKIHVICIPAVENDIISAEVNLIEIQERSYIYSETLDPETRELERQLKQVPNIMEFRKATFSWDHHMLVEENVTQRTINKERRGRYFMYKCTDPSLGLPANRVFAGHYGLRVYGDVFIFMLKESGSSELESPRYAKMGWTIDWYDIRFIFATLASKRDPTRTARNE